MPKRLNQLNDDISERKSYLEQIEESIAIAERNGELAMRDLKAEIERLENKKARLMKELLAIKQEIEIAKHTLTAV